MSTLVQGKTRNGKFDFKRLIREYSHMWNYVLSGWIMIFQTDDRIFHSNKSTPVIGWKNNTWDTSKKFDSSCRLFILLSKIGFSTETRQRKNNAILYRYTFIIHTYTCSRKCTESADSSAKNSRRLVQNNKIVFQRSLEFSRVC